MAALPVAVAGLSRWGGNARSERRGEAVDRTRECSDRRFAVDLTVRDIVIEGLDELIELLGLRRCRPWRRREDQSLDLLDELLSYRRSNTPVSHTGRERRDDATNSRSDRGGRGGGCRGCGRGCGRSRGGRRCRRRSVACVRWRRRRPRAGEDAAERQTEEQADHDEAEQDGQRPLPEGAPASSPRQVLDYWCNPGGAQERPQSDRGAASRRWDRRERRSYR